MQKPTTSALVRLVDQLEMAVSPDEFYATLGQSYERAAELFFPKVGGATPILKALEEAFTQLGTHQRRRRMLELIVWPLLDKPALPAEPDALPEFVWMFQVPVVVTLPHSALERITVLNNSGLDVEAICSALEASEALAEGVLVKAWPTMYRREDAYAYGPYQLAAGMMELHAQPESAECKQALPVVLDPELEHVRTVTLHVWLGARMMVGSHTLLTRKPLEDLTRMAIERSVLGWLNQQGLVGASCKAFDPCGMAEGYFPNSPAWQFEMSETLRMAQELNTVESFKVTFPAPGYFELIAADQHILMPSMGTTATNPMLRAALTELANVSGVPLSGSSSPRSQVSGLMH